MMNNTQETYGLVAQVLHWTTAVLILTLLPLGVYMHELPIDTQQAIDEKFWFYSLHKTLGVSVFIVAILRVGWALVQPHPQLLNAENKLESLAAQTVHWSLYACIILMPLTGWLHHSATQGFAEIWWPLFQDLPFVPKDPVIAQFFADLHFAVGVILATSLVLHIAGAAKHTVIDRDSTLARMVPGMKPSLPKLAGETSSGRMPVMLAAIPFVLVGTITAFSLVSGQNNDVQAVVRSNTVTETASTWSVDHSASQLAIEILQSGAPVRGKFATWKADISFDPDNLDASQIRVEVDIASLELGSVTPQATSADFLNAAAHPKAVYFSDEVVSTDDGAYESKGELSLSGVTQPFSLPFTLRIEEDRAFVSIDTNLKRLEFGIGAKGFPNGNTIALEVKIRVDLEADRNS